MFYSAYIETVQSVERIWYLQWCRCFPDPPKLSGQLHEVSCYPSTFRHARLGFSVAKVRHGQREVVVVEKINAALGPASTRQGVAEPNKEDGLLLRQNSQIIAQISFAGAAGDTFRTAAGRI